MEGVTPRRFVETVMVAAGQRSKFQAPSTRENPSNKLQNRDSEEKAKYIRGFNGPSWQFSYVAPSGQVFGHEANAPGGGIFGAFPATEPTSPTSLAPKSCRAQSAP